MDQLNDPKKNVLLEYRKVARRLYKAFQNNAKKTIIARGSGFNVDFTKDDPTGNIEELKGRDRSCSQKRAGIILIKEGLSSSKKLKNPKCLVYGIKGYVLLDCWTVFKSKRLEGFKPSKGIINRVRERLATDKGLTAKVEKLKL